MPNPFFLYGAAGLALLAFGAGWKVRDWRCDAAQTAAVEQAAKQTQEMQDEVDTQAATYEETRVATYGGGARVEREIRTIYREVPAASPACEPDPRVISLLQERLVSANASASGELGE
jgi:hypothetical protein